jgi:hypothetical protein
MRLLAPSLVCSLALLAAAPAAPAAERSIRHSGFGDVAVAEGQYRLRLSYTVLERWPERGTGRPLRRSWGPVGTCRFTVTLTARAVTDVVEAASARVERLVPGSGQYVQDVGSRNGAAWKVVRERGSARVSGLFTRAAPTVRRRPVDGSRIWLEVRIVGTPRPGIECHAGGPRTIATRAGDTFASTAIGGFQL